MDRHHDPYTPDSEPDLGPDGSGAASLGGRCDAQLGDGRRRGFAAWLEAFLDKHLRSGGREWAAACHLLPLVAYAAPIPGLAALVAWGIWRLKRDGEPGVAAHGREALNLHINVGILSVLTIVIFPLWIALNGAAIFLAVKAALRAIEGESWRYPWIVRLVD